MANSKAHRERIDNGIDVAGVEQRGENITELSPCDIVTIILPATSKVNLTPNYHNSTMRGNMSSEPGPFPQGLGKVLIDFW